MDFWISVWISADGVRDFFRDGPLGRFEHIVGVRASTVRVIVVFEAVQVRAWIDNPWRYKCSSCS